MRRFGFTLIEVNLAMFVMAVGTLGLVGLYAFGYRENQQSNEDVRAAAVAEMNLNAMIAALSSTNMTWEAWKGIGAQPESGWGEYAGDGTDSGVSENDGKTPTVPLKDPSSVAGKIFGDVMSAAGFSANFEDNGMAVAIVILPSADYRTYSISVRCGNRASTLLYQPLYYSEVYFQGLKE